ncbi:P-loop containing nucleoside triphosphate hydrolase protein [Rhizophagus irregularis]|uniref:P-loop containing nucleoside triphosphate hydrolase protein n=1 Tax=Rhizophagus irregularis TaxID=588596 RepID=A0A2I1EY90_9GLOM|nr:P-loop containing nucleoside triphosphate hydrolase protein [Rhizophagus irregularis]PKC70731.1 P-loop containing nucleoside triphosphate hydrolase protein [Rhizophagus irregularis]PKY27086.1 P-loop containing nucleoside triphosphate hydrolase protein [Rhizophagus irregularis]
MSLIVYDYHTTERSAGKSTLGNLLLGAPHKKGPFATGSRMDSITQECKAETMLIDDVPYNIVDTPGILDPNRGTIPILNEISKTINKCAHGVKAILIVSEVGRFTDEQKDALNRIRNFLGKDATNNIISVLSRADKDQTEDRSIMQSDWNQSFRSFIQGIGNRWGISPNPEIFPAGEETHKVRLGEIKNLISSIQGVYTTEQHEKCQREQAEARRRKEEDEKRAKREHDEKLKEDARREAERAHQREFNQMRQEYEKQHRQILEKMIESLRREKENERQEREKERQEAREHQERRRQEERERQERERQERRQQELKDGIMFAASEALKMAFYAFI